MKVVGAENVEHFDYFCIYQHFSIYLNIKENSLWVNRMYQAVNMEELSEKLDIPLAKDYNVKLKSMKCLSETSYLIVEVEKEG